VRIWVKDFGKWERPLVVLMKKDVEFVWGPEQEKVMEDLSKLSLWCHAFSQLIITVI